MTQKASKSLFNAAGFETTPVFKKGGTLKATVEPEVTGTLSDETETKLATRDYSKGAFIGKMFQMRDITHLLHLKASGTGSYAEHMALGGFYDDLLTFIDTIAEIYQSSELLDIRIPATVIDKTSIEYISTFKKDIKAYKDKCDWDEVVNLLEEVMALCSAAVYKLKFLK